MNNTNEALERLRIADSQGVEWANLLRDADTDPQILQDVVSVVRQALAEYEDVSTRFGVGQ